MLFLNPCSRSCGCFVGEKLFWQPLLTQKGAPFTECASSSCGSSRVRKPPKKEPLLNGVFQGLTCFEARYFRGRDLDFSAGLRVAAGTGCTLFHREGTETDQGNLVAFLQSTGDGAGHCIQRTRSEEHTSELQSRPHLVCR